MKVGPMLYKAILSEKTLAGFVFLAFGFLHLHIVTSNHYNFKTYSFDYGVYNFAFYDFAHWRVSPCLLYHDPNNGDLTFLQDHFSLTLILLSPLYWIFNPVFGTYSLLIIQWLLIMLGAYATYKFLLLKTRNFVLALSAMIYYFILYSRFSSYDADCNLVIMGSALLPVFLLLFEKKKRWLLLLVFLVLVFNREDVSIGLFFLCVMLAVIHRKDKEQRTWAIALAGMSIVSFVIIFTWLIPLFEDHRKSFNLFNYRALGQDPAEAFVFMFQHPLKTINLLFINPTNDPAFDGIKLQFYVVFFISGGFMLFYRPVYFIGLIPLIAKKMFNDEPHRWSHESYHSIEIATLLPIFVFMALGDIKRNLARQLCILTVCVLTAEVTLYNFTKARFYYFGVNKFNFLSDRLYVTDENAEKLREVIKKIPDHASVCASGRITPHLAFRDEIRLFPEVRGADYVLAHKIGFTFPISQERYDQELNKLIQSGDWIILEDHPDFIALKRKPRL
jgi:uncharacterized membrane protein